jgi:toxin ParE1/3/4
MNWRVLLSQDAEGDIEDLYHFIAQRDGIGTAERILGEIEAAIMVSMNSPSAEMSLKNSSP